ncbi:MAG: hypothetical protein AAFO29_05145, partial [Actinomycetota bacterium]
MSHGLEASARRHALNAVARTAALYLVAGLAASFDALVAFSAPVWLLPVFFIPLVATVALPLGPIAQAVAGRIRPVSSTTTWHNVVTEIAIGLGEPVEQIQVHDSDVPNVAMLPITGAEVVVATRGALDLLGRYELQALVAAQFAGMRDRWCRVATRAEILWKAAPLLSLTFLPGLVLGAIATAVTGFVMIFVVAFVPRWNEQARDLCADVAAVRTTFDPPSLASAMRKLADRADAAHKVDIGRWYLPVSPFLVLPRRWKSNTTMTVGSSTRAWTSTDEVRMELRPNSRPVSALASAPLAIASARSARSRSSIRTSSVEVHARVDR